MKWKRVERRSAASAVRSAADPGVNESVLQFSADLEPLEPRTLFSVSMAFESLINTSRLPGNQSETAIAIDPTNPNRLFGSANTGAFREPDQGPNDPISEQGIFTTVSTDGGATWTPRIIAAGNDAFPVACCDPSAAFDDFGNLYFVYLGTDPVTGGNSVVVLLSTDGGQTFAVNQTFAGASGSVDRPEVTASRLPDGTTAVAVSFVDFDPSADAEQSARVQATGLGQIGTWVGPVSLPQSGFGANGLVSANVGDPGIGPDGQVMVAWQTVGNADAEKVFVNTDPDGFGPAPFGNAVFIDQTQVGTKETIPGQPARGLSLVATVDFDRSNGPHRGRAYLVYTQNTTETRLDDLGFPIGVSTDTDVMLRFSDDNGQTWSPAIRVNDDPVNSQASQFFQRVRVDPITGNVAVGWLDTRDDTDSNPADDVGYYVTVGQAVGNGIQFAPNMRLNVGLSNARFSGNFGNDFGDYTGLDFYNNVLWANYPDNSNSTGDNPSGKLRAYDIYAARVRVTDTTVAPPLSVGPASPLSPTVVRPPSLIRKGRFYQLKVTYSHPSGINLSTVGNDDILVTGPNGFSQPMQLVKAKAGKKGTVVQATYRLPAPGGTWDNAENGVYTPTLQAGSVTSNDGTVTSTGGTLTNVLVNVNPPKVKKGKKEAAAAPALQRLTPADTAGGPVTAASVFSDASLLSAKEDDSLRLLA